MEREQEVKNQSEDLKQNAKGDYLITDESGKKHLIKADIANKWLEAFNLKSLDESFVPNFSDEVKELLAQNGVNEIKLTKGSLIKLSKRDREEFIPFIKETLEDRDLILDNGKGILFIKEFVDSDKNRYFMSVAKDFNGEWVFASHTRREFKNIQNEINKSKILYKKEFKGREVASASDILESGGTTIKPSLLQIEYPANHSSGINSNQIIPQKNNQSQALDMNDDSALNAIKNEVSSIKESQVKDNTSSQDYQTKLSDNEKALFGSQAKNQQYKRQRR